jgi:hypothetical protein
MLVCTYISCLFGVNNTHSYILLGNAVAQLVEALNYNPEGPGSIPAGFVEIFH